MLCVGVGRKNSLVKLHYSTLCLRVSCIRARQNSFNCCVSPGHKKMILSSLKLIWKQTTANRVQWQNIFILSPFKRWIHRVCVGWALCWWSTKQTEQETSSQGMRVAPNCMWLETPPDLCIRQQRSKDCIESLLKCINLFLKVIE